MNSLELRIPPLAIVLGFAAAMGLVSRYLPGTVDIPGSMAIALALILVLCGFLAALAGVLEFRRQRTTVNPFTPGKSSSLVTTGIYHYSRNPMYLGFLLALLGWCVYLSSGTAALLLPLFIACLNSLQIKPEERVLAQKFGAEFSAYTSSTRRWL
jgi:protein-S-isoprenylcysteine O-methyltransferase Ste14